MALEWVKTVGAALVSWPMVAMIALLVLRRRLLALVDRFTGPDVERLRIGGVELELVINRVEERQDRQESEIKAIQAALKGVLTKHEIGLLRGLNAPTRLMVTYEPDLYPYLHRLDGLDFVQPNPGYGLITIVNQHRDDEQLPPDRRPRFDLKEYVHITDEGRRYLDTLNDVIGTTEGPR